MKLRILFFSLLLCMLLPGVAHGQCNIITTTNYATLNSEALTDDNHIITSVLVEGSATMNMNPSCPCTNCITQFNNNKQYITHFPYITNTINGVGRRTAGPTFCAECYSSYQANADSGPLTPGQIVSGEQGGEVDCSTAGQIFSFLSNFHFEVAFTRFLTGTYFVDRSGVPPLRYYTITPYCTPETTPPDWTGAGDYWVTVDPPTIPTDVVDGKTICARYSTGPWGCLPVGRFYGSYSSPCPKAFCTHNP